MNQFSLGVPGEGVHTHFMGVAWRDVVATILSGVVLALVFKWNIGYTVLALFLIGIGLHRWFNVRTTVDKLLFP